MYEQKVNTTYTILDLDERANRILDVATRLIVRYGYDKTTMDDIAAEANVSKSATYLYWKSKDELFRALITRETLQFFDEWLERVQADPAGGTLFNIYRQGFLTLLAHPLMRAFYTRDSYVLGNYVRRRGPMVYVRPYLLNRAFVRQLQAAGLIRTDMRDDVINHVLMLISIGLFSIGELIPQEHSPPFEEVADALAEMVQRAMESAHPGDPERGKQALQAYLEQLSTGASE